MKFSSVNYLTSCFYSGLLIISCFSFFAHSRPVPHPDSAKVLAAEVMADKKNASQYQVNIKARKNYDFLLSADYRFFANKASAKHMPGVLILHDCESNRDSYKTLSTSIAKLGIHTLSLDLRGYGKSINDAYSQKKSKQTAKNIVDFHSEVASLMSYWPEDILAAYNFLRTKVDKSKGISVVASGCSSPYAVGLAESVYVKSLVLLTPVMNYGDKERYKNLVDIPSYFINSAQHTASYAIAQELFAWNGDRHSKLQVYKGDKVSHSIIKGNVNLVNDIALWLKSTLR